MKSRWGLPLTLILTACVTSPLPPGTNRLDAGHAPTPFSAAQIREACPDGTWIRFQVEGPDGPAAFLVFRFLNGGPDEVTVVSATFDADEHPLGEPSAKRLRWSELQAHASFPAALVRIEAETFDTFRGRSDGWIYTVREERDGHAILTRYAFARDLPGPPVLLEEFTGGALTRRMRMVGRGAE